MSDKNLKIMRLALNEIIKYVNECNNIITVQEEQILQFCDVLLEAKDNNSRIFVGGSGRSGLVGKFFAMRLMHLGFEVYVFGESIVRGFKENDVVVLISNSGKKKSIPRILQDKKKRKVKLLALCGTKNSSLYEYSDNSIVIEDMDGNASSSQLEMLKELDFDYRDLIVMGTAFEISALVLLDSMIIELMGRLKISSKDMKDRHDALVKSVILKEGYDNDLKLR